MRLDSSNVRLVAIVVATGLGVIAAFQAALAIGVPWGHAAWGGRSETRQPDLRLASGAGGRLAPGRRCRPWTGRLLGTSPGGTAFRRATWLLAPMLALERW